MSQEKTRQNLNRYIVEEGVTAKHICQKLGLHESVLSKFRKNKTDLYPEQIEMIENFLSLRKL